METSRIIYYCFLALSLTLSIFAYKKDKSLKIFPYLITTSLLTEILTPVLKYYNINSYFVYHFYIPIEYAFWAYYFFAISDSRNIKRILQYSVLLFLILCLLVSISFVKLDEYPNIQFNIEGIFLIIIAIYTIFTIKAEKKTSLFSQPVFWISVAILIYHTIISPFIGLYNYVLESTDDLHTVLKLYLLYVPNYILYTCLSIAFICSLRMKK